MIEKGWQQIDKNQLKPGDIIIWEKEDFGEEGIHGHIGFYIGKEKAISNSHTKKTPVIAIVTKDFTYDKMISNIGEVKARGPQVIAIAEEDDTEIEKHADFVLRIPSNQGIFSSIPIVVTLQLLAYHVAFLRDCAIDKPRNLAKSVTVE